MSTQDYADSRTNAHTDDHDARPTLRCTITACPARVTERVEHPQRGELPVCRYHAEEIRGLAAWRFIGIREISDHREVNRR